MNDYIEFLKAGGKVIRFEETELTADEMHTIEQAALSSFHTSDSQPWFFVFLQDKETVKMAEGLIGVSDSTKGAPLAVACFYQKRVMNADTETVFAMHNMMVTAGMIGLDTILVPELHFVFSHPSFAGLAESMGVPEGYACAGVFACGHAAVREKTEPDDNYHIFSYVQ